MAEVEQTQTENSSEPWSAHLAREGAALRKKAEKKAEKQAAEKGKIDWALWPVYKAKDRHKNFLKFARHCWNNGITKSCDQLDDLLFAFFEQKCDQPDDLDIAREEIAEIAKNFAKFPPSETAIIRRIREIREMKEGKKNISAARKLDSIRQLVLDDLFVGDEPVGLPFVNRPEKVAYLFHSERKALLNLDDIDFEVFFFNRYQLSENEIREVKKAVFAFAWQAGQELQPKLFSYFNPETFALYISNGEACAFYLDGETIRQVDNGTDGIYFRGNPGQIVKVIDGPPRNYFQDGFAWPEFQRGLLYKYFISKANFQTEEIHALSADEQQYLLTIYFYAICFESIFSDKPIPCFTGVKSSGKTTLSAAPGKILFGDSFQPFMLPNDQRDLRTLLIRNHLLIFDNLDSRVPDEMLDSLCIAATGGEVAERKYYTNNQMISAVPHCFIMLTSRNPHFRRDDIVSRLLVFNTEKISKVIDSRFIFNEIKNHRNEIWAEILLNLNSIIRLLKEKKDWNPAGISRNASFELFGKKIHNEHGLNYFQKLITKMQKEKNSFGLEEDIRFRLLLKVVDHNAIDGKTPAEIFIELLTAAKDQKQERLFERICTGDRSLGRWLKNYIDELKDFFRLEISTDKHIKSTIYSISKKELENEQS